MLRSALITVGALCLILGAAALMSGVVHPSVVFILWGGIILAAIFLERFRYKPIADGQPGPDWERSAERFEDPETGKSVTVYTQPKTGERRYVAE